MGTSRPSAPTPGFSWCPTCRAVFRGGFARCPNDGARLEPGNDDPLVGSILAERYQIESIIGDGGIGRVYRARHVRMSRRFAIKVPFGELGYDKKVRARFANEAEAASRLSHPNVIGVIDVGETAEGLFYLAMDLAEGTALADVVMKGPVPTERALRIIAQIADGLAHAHEHGLIHRDLKPDNVILSRGPDGRDHVRIVDFGLAVVQSDHERNRLTTEGVVLGTPHYMAPEQATDEHIDHRVDLFALGLILYEMIAGVLPFDGTPIDVARQNLSRELPTMARRLGQPVDSLLELLVQWLTRKYPAQRPERAAQVATIARMMISGDRDGAASCIPGAAPAPAVVELVDVDDTDPEVDAMVPASGAMAAAGRPTTPGKVAPIGRAPTLSQPAEAPRRITPPAVAESIAPPAPPPVPSGAPTLPETAVVLRPDAGDQLTTLEGLEAIDEPRRDRKLAVIAALLLIALCAVVAIVMLSGRGGKSHAAIDAAVAVIDLPADAAEPIAPAIDAEVVIAPAPIDAGVREVPHDAPRIARRVDAAERVVVAPPRDAAAPMVVKPDAAPAAGADDEARAKQTFKALYARVGRELDVAFSHFGDDATRDMRKRYAAIPYLEAIRKADLRVQAMKDLMVLEHDVGGLQ